MCNDKTALLSDIETELKPIYDYMKVIYIDNELKSIALNCSFKAFNLQFPNIKKKELIKLLDWFNDNIKATQEVINNIEVL